MLKNMRENLKSYHWVLWLVILSFVISIFFWDTGVSWTGGVGSGWAATVNGEDIGSDEFQQAFRNQVEFLRRAFGDRWDPMYVEQVGVADQVLDSLVRQKVALQEARSMGLDATPREIMHEVKQNPIFVDENGKFIGVGKYQEILRRNNLDVDGFEADLNDQITFRKFQDLLKASVVVSDADADRALRNDRDQTTIEYALFDAGSFDAPAEPSDQELRAWYDSHLEDYSEGDVRVVEYLHLTQAMALAAVGSDEEIEKYYNANQERFTVPAGSRRARQILVRVLPSATQEERNAGEALAESLAARAQAGEDFETLARENSDDITQARRGGDMGYFSPGELMPPIDAALFAMEEGEIRGPINTPMGYHIVQLTDGSGEEKVRPLADVREEIGAILYFSEMQEWLANQSAQIAQSSGGTIQDRASQFGLQIHTSRVSGDAGIRELGTFPEVSGAIGLLEPGTISDPLTVVDGEIAFLSVQKVEQALARPFEEVRARVKADWSAAQSLEAARVAAEAAHTAVSGGTELADAVAEHGIDIEEPAPFTREGTVGELGTEPVLARTAFDLGVGELGPVSKTASGYVVFRVKDRTELTDEEVETQRPTYRRYLESIRFQQVWDQALQRLMEDSRVKVNNRLVNAVKSDYISRTTDDETAAGG